MAVELSSPPNTAALRPYVPETLIEQWQRGRERGSPIWHEWLEGALMHCDITGFTAMSESLQSLGREGAELMASVLNRFFDTMLGVADTWHGVQMKFGGDAMLLYFDGGDGASRAAACGLEMQRNMPQFRQVKVAGQSYVLRMRIGIHAGRFFSASVGDGDGLLHYLLLGRDVNRTASIEAEAQPGQVVATAAAASAMLGAQTTQADEDVWRVRSIGIQPPASHDQIAMPDANLVRRYVLPAVAEALHEGSSVGLPSEQRRVTSMFVTLDGTTDLLERAGEGETLRQVNAYTNMLIAAVTRHGGVLLGSDVADHGDKFIVLFGAPTLVEEHEASALRCAIELSEGLSALSLDLQHQVGVNTGSVFAGEIGSRSRREYTVIGDTVNLAARLMAAAKHGETLVSATTVQRIARGFELRRRKPIRVKGKSAPIALFVLAGASMASDHARSDELPFVGRATEIDALLKVARRARRGAPAWCVVSGDAGIGKSRLVSEAARRLDGWRTLHATARSHTAGTPFGVWIDPLIRMTGVREAADEERAFATLRDSIARVAPGQVTFAAILADLLGIPHADDELVGSLDAKARRERLTSLVVAVVESYANDASLALILDDAQWCDVASLELLDAVLARTHAPLVVYVTTRDAAPPEQITARPREGHIELRGLAAAEARELIAPLVADEDAVRRVVARGQGNPLFLIELAQAPAGSAMPETVNDVVLARLDALRRSDREMLRLASVIGPSFALPSLLALETSVTETYVRDACGRLAGAGFLRSEGEAYAFAHSLTREVAYETLLYADRRRLHRTLAVHLEQQQDPASIAETLLHHYRSAREWGRVARYGVLSGDRAAGLFATAEAVRYYEDALTGLDEIGPTVRVDRSVVMERLGDALDSAGRQREAGDAYFTALSEWLTRGSARRPRYVRIDVRAKAREALICRKISVSYERRSDYEQALSWIDEALNRLPAGPASVAAEVMASKSVTLFRKGQYADAIDWGKRAVSLARRARDPRIMAYAHNMLANSYIEQGALKLAVRHLIPSTRLYHDLRDLRGQSAAGNNLASCYQLLGNMDQALYHYQDALQADARLGNLTHAAIIHNNIGEVLLALGRVHEAEEHLQEVLTTHASNPGLAALAGLSEVNLSRCALIRGDVKAAEQHVSRGIRRLRQVGAQGLLDEAELQLVEVRIAQSRWKDALKRSRALVERSRESGAQLMEARGERLIGVAQRGLGDLAAAEERLRSSATLARKIAARIEEMHALVELAGVLIDTGRVKQGAAVIARAETIATSVGDARKIDALAALRKQAGAPTPE